MAKRTTVVVDKGSKAEFTGELVGGEWDGYLVRQAGTNRIDWFQKSRVTFR